MDGVFFLLLSVALDSSCESRATLGGENLFTTVILEFHAVQKPRTNCEKAVKLRDFGSLGDFRSLYYVRLL